MCHEFIILNTLKTRNVASRRACLCGYDGFTSVFRKNRLGEGNCCKIDLMESDEPIQDYGI